MRLVPSPKTGMREGRRGAAVVELAFVAPLFLLLLGGIIEFGQAFRIQHALSTSARSGARAAAIHGSTNALLTQNVQARCSKILGTAAGNITVAIAVDGTANGDLTTAKAGNEVSVTVSIPYSKVGVGFITNTFATSTLRATCTLEHE